MDKKITIKDISNKLGLSSYTVSRALSGKPGVNEITRKRVIEASRDMGYDRNLQAESNKNILLFIPKTDYKDSAFWMKIVRGIEYEASRNGYALLVKFLDIDDLDSQISISSNVVGIIYASSKSVKVWEKNRFDKPSIVMAYPSSHMMDIDIFYNSLHESAFAITSQLISWGHRDFAFYGSLSRASSIHTMEGMIDTLKKHGLDFKHMWTSPDDLQISCLNDKLKELQRKKELPTAILCVSDNLAVSIIYTLSQLGISVPEQISVAGCNGDVNNDWVLPITSVGNDNQRMGGQAFNFLLDRIRHPDMPFRRMTVKPELFLRETAGPCINVL